MKIILWFLAMLTLCVGGLGSELTLGFLPVFTMWYLLGLAVSK